MSLKDIIVATQADLRTNPAHALATFSADSRQVEGLRSETKIRQFSLTVDEPPSLGGTDTGPNPVELVLAALATCQEITYRAYATALGIPLDSVSVKLEGSLDLRGFFAVKDDVRRLQRSARRRQSEKQRPCRRSRQVEGRGRRALPGARHSARAGSGGAEAGNRAGGPGGLGRGEARCVGNTPKAAETIENPGEALAADPGFLRSSLLGFVGRGLVTVTVTFA